MKIAIIVASIFIFSTVSSPNGLVLSTPRKHVRISGNCGYNRGDFFRGLHAISSALKFFENHAEFLVLDAAIGTRILEAQLKQLLLKHEDIPLPLATYVLSLQHRAEIISDRLVHKVLEFLSGPNYTEGYAGLRSSLPWIMNSSIWNVSTTWKPTRVMDTLELSPLVVSKSVSRNQTLTEETSDRCIGNLFRTCDLDKQCVQAFAQSGEDDYALTHQVLFMIIANKQGCFQAQDFVEAIGGKTFEELIQQLCVNVWHQMKEAYTDGNVDPTQRDLFSEQATVCALVGYPNVLDPRWFETILSWQHAKYGCFYHARTEVEDVMDEAENRRQAHPLAKRSDSFVPATKSKVCSVHFTSVNIGAISLYLRRFADICFQG